MDGKPTLVPLLPTVDSVPNPAWHPHTDDERLAVRGQLERIVASAIFRNSQRYPNLLRYIVDRTLNGEADLLKERTIGTDVFGKAPDYDTNADHVVRSAAGEVRKRLAQYYTEPGREREIRIEVHAGSYVPQFRLPVVNPALAASSTRDTDVSPAASAPRTGLRWAVGRVVWIAIIVSAIAVASYLLAPEPGRTALFHRPDALDRFWSPILQSPQPTLICIGSWQRGVGPAGEAAARTINSRRPLTLGEFYAEPSEQVAASDALTLARLSGLLQQRAKNFRVLTQSEATLRDLMSGPAVLIGASNNEWTLRLTEGLRFSFEGGWGAQKLTIRDKQDPSRNEWSVDYSTPYMEFSRDYALIVRARDPETERPIVVAAGTAGFGTLAAGEFLTNPAYMKKLEALAPKDWSGKNIEIVISMEVLRGNGGPPNIVAAYFW